MRKEREAGDILLSETKKAHGCGRFQKANMNFGAVARAHVLNETAIVTSPLHPTAQDEDQASRSPDSAARSDLGPTELGCWGADLSVGRGFSLC